MTKQVEIKDGFLAVPMPEFKDGKYEIRIASLDTRTSAQNSAFWLWMSMIANKLNQPPQIPIEKLFRLDVTWDKDKVKEMFADEVLKKSFGVDSSTKLAKQDMDKFIDIMCLAFGYSGVELPEFPSVKIKEKENVQ